MNKYENNRSLWPLSKITEVRLVISRPYYKTVSPARVETKLFFGINRTYQSNEEENKSSKKISPAKLSQY